jgi:uncharacterized membrane protein
MRNWFFRRRPVPAPIRRNIESITQLEQAFVQQRTAVDVISDTVTGFTGSLRFILAHAAFFTAWILLNTVLLPAADRFDPFPFGFLGLVVGLEAIFLSTFVLMSQNRQNRMADQWAHVDLQVTLLAEQENTKMLQMLQRIYDFLGLEKETRHDKELKELVEATQVERLVEELAKARDPEKPENPPPPQDERRG